MIQVAEENYNKFPDYLFAKINLIEILIRRGEYEKIPEILENR
jgi:hypothetical protein